MPEQSLIQRRKKRIIITEKNSALLVGTPPLAGVGRCRDKAAKAKT